jgi:GT2 family glycosyltransferase
MTTGIAIITCDRVPMFERCINSVLDTHSAKFEQLVVVNDGSDEIPKGDYQIINNDKNLGVGESKNIAIRNLIESNCDNLFIVEDDVVFKNEHVTSQYIKLAELSGVKHFNFCLHGDANMRLDVPAVKLLIDYKDIKMALYHNVTGAVSYYTSEVIDECGLMDDVYKNAMEHVDHTMRIIQAGHHPPFRWFADIENSSDFIGDQDPDLVESKIRNDEEWKDNFIHGVKTFHDRYGINVCSNEQPEDSKQQVIDFLKNIKP